MAAGLRPKRFRGRTALAISLVWSALLVAAPALSQPPAAKDPRVTGPLYLVGMSCGDNKLKHEGDTLAAVESCIRLYEYDTLSETDVVNTYGVAWVQTSVNPVGGWCATQVETEVVLPGTVTTHATAPKKGVSPRKRDTVSVKITSSAGGAGIQDASIRQNLDVYPKSLQPEVAKNGRIVRTNWRGRESSNLAFVAAAEISWQMLDSPQIRGGLGQMRFIKAPGC